MSRIASGISDFTPTTTIALIILLKDPLQSPAKPCKALQSPSLGFIQKQKMFTPDNNIYLLSFIIVYGLCAVVDQADSGHLSRRISAANLKLTPQRLAIYGALLRSKDHPSLETLYHLVKRQMPSLSLATVYKTLDVFESAGLISQIAIQNESKRYDANLKPHHHLVCTECRGITDFTDETLSSLKLRIPGYGFRPVEIKIQIMGVCARCERSVCTRKSDAVDQVSMAMK